MTEQAVASPFVEGTAIQFAWDSTSLSTAMACARRYLYSIIEGWQPKSPDSAIALVFGILVHSGIEQYHRERAAGKGYEQAILGALRYVSQREENGKRLVLLLPTEHDINELKQEDADDEESDGFNLRNSKIRTRYHLFRALVWYFEQYRQDHLIVQILQSGSAAVEHSFRVPVGKSLSDGTPLLLSGHYDKIVEFNGELFVSDVKTTKALTHSWRAGFDLSHQMTGYIAGGKIALHKPVKGAWIDALQLQVGGVKFSRFTTTRSESQLQEFLADLEYYARLAETWYLDQHYPLNTSACFLCIYKDVCRQPPEFRQAYLQTYYEQKPAWNPLKSR
jgi:hypothetical protein